MEDTNSNQPFAPPPYNQYQNDQPFENEPVQDAQPPRQWSMLDVVDLPTTRPGQGATHSRRRSMLDVNDDSTSPPYQSETQPRRRSMLDVGPPSNIQPSARPPSSHVTRPSSSSSAAPLQLASSGGFLVLDGHNIYIQGDAGSPNHTLYSLPRAINWSGGEIYLGLPVDPQKPGEKTEHIYLMQRTVFEVSGTMIPKRKRCITSKYLSIGKNFGIGGMAWEVSVDDEKVVIRLVRGKWRFENHPTKGKSSGRVIAFENDNPHVLKLSPGVEEEVRDVLVAAWVAKLWLEKTKPRISTPSGTSAFKPR